MKILKSALFLFFVYLITEVSESVLITKTPVGESFSARWIVNHLIYSLVFGALYGAFVSKRGAV